MDHLAPFLHSLQITARKLMLVTGTKQNKKRKQRFNKIRILVRKEAEAICHSKTVKYLFLFFSQSHSMKKQRTDFKIPREEILHLYPKYDQEESARVWLSEVVSATGFNTGPWVIRSLESRGVSQPEICWLEVTEMGCDGM